MRVAIIGTRGYPYVYSGYETFVSELAPRLAERGHAVTVYCHRSLFRTRPSTVKGIKLVYLPALERKVFSQFSHSLLSTIHACLSRHDIVLFVNSANGPFGLLTRAFRKRTAINVDGIEWLRPKWKGLGAKYFHFASYLSTKLFDVVICDSTRMAEIYKKEFGAKSVTIAYGATPGVSEDSEPITRWGLVPESYYLVVGRLIPDNNADVIIKGFEKTHSERRLVILGDVPYHDAYAESVRETSDPRIIFPGYVKDQAVLRELYCNAYAYIHGHEFGGTNPSLLKALANGCCVLALDTPFSREVLADDAHGLYFTKAETSVRESIERLELSPEVRMRFKNTARSRITEKYTWEGITDQYERLFDHLMNK